ncbi:hypothetical protein [Mycobacteroides abscessus]|uniref:hypothetical protein n=2 Tax=Mycobacteroides abscessus TaxID=36809 RepID=UPI002103A419|nr:hypothetical protein [Mycobacteroides abscessus]
MSDDESYSLKMRRQQWIIAIITIAMLILLYYLLKWSNYTGTVKEIALGVILNLLTSLLIVLLLYLVFARKGIPNYLTLTRNAVKETFESVIENDQVEVVDSELEVLRKKLYRCASAIVSSQRANSEYFTILSWHESMVIKSNGDGILDKEFRLRAGIGGVDVFFTTISSTIPCTDEDQRQKIVESISVYKMLQDGNRMGVRGDDIWEKDDMTLRIIVHLDPKIEPNTEFTIGIELDWPGYTNALALGEVEPMDWKFTKAVSDFDYKLTFDRGFRPLKKPSIELSPGLEGRVSYGLSEYAVSVTGHDLAPGFEGWLRVDPGVKK